MNIPNWTDEEWDQVVSVDKSAKLFGDLIKYESEIESASDRFDYARCKWLALTHTNVVALNENGIPFDDKKYLKLSREATFEWLRKCVNTRSDIAEARESNFFFTLKGIDREEDIRRIIKSRCIFSDEECKDEIGKKQRFIYLEYLALWFLKRYDHITSFRIVRKICSFRYKYHHRIFPPKLTLPILIILMALFVVRLICNVDMVVFGYDWKTFSQMDHFGVFEDVEFFAGGWNITRTIESLALALAGIILAFWILDTSRSTSFLLWANFLHIRLASGIVIGYIALLFQSDMWKLALEIDRIKGSTIVFSASLFSLYYLFSEIKNVVQNARTAIYRCLRLWLIGLFESLALGIIAQDLLSWFYIESHTNIGVTGLFAGLIYPKILILFAPLALAIGIFVQIIWEDKPITYPF